MVVLYLCFILALKSKPPKKLIVYAYSRIFCDNKISLGRIEILSKNAVITKISP